MQILYIGAGFVGACSAAVSAESGHTVLVYDLDAEKIAKLGSGDATRINSCIFENGLSDLLIQNKERIRFTADYNDVVSFLDTCDAVFMCLPTPEIGETGESDLRYYTAAAEELAQALAKRNNGTQSKYIVVVNKSTVPIDMIDKTEVILKKHQVTGVGVVSNPEFLVEGKAIIGSLSPDRVVVGAWNQKDFEVMRSVYHRFYGVQTVQYLEVNPKEAAAGKLLANFFLFNKLAVCFDVMGRTCETFSDLQFEQVRRIVGSDPRIGLWGLYDSLYSGGSCFIKDARSLSHQLQIAGQNATLVNETYLANKRQLEAFIGRAEKEAGVSWSGKTVALCGLAFKQDTNDTRNSPSIIITQFLLERGVARINAYDPAAVSLFKTSFPTASEIVYTENEAAALRDADVVIIATDWPQFRELGPLLAGLKKKPLLMDGRRMLSHVYIDLVKAGIPVVAVGSPFYSASQQ